MKTKNKNIFLIIIAIIGIGITINDANIKLEATNTSPTERNNEILEKSDKTISNVETLDDNDLENLPFESFLMTK